MVLTTARRMGLVVALILAVAACGGGDEQAAGGSDTSTPAPAETEATSEEPSEPSAPESEAQGEAAAAVALMTADSDLGEILVDADGRTLYMFDNDSDGTSSCYDDCETNWPPLIGEAEAGEGADEGLLGTAERTDGSGQVTYAGKPLYYFAGDEQPGDTNGQGVGDVWWAMGADGEQIADSAAASAAEEY